MSRTFVFDPAPAVLAAAAVGGMTEKDGPLNDSFDYFFADDQTASDSFEAAEGKLLHKATELCLQKAGLRHGELDLFFAGDLMNQITSSSFAAEKLRVPYFGTFAACATMAENLILSALLVSSGQAQNVLAGSVSHNKSAERQFRYPNEYGFQKPPSGQFTATAAGAALIAKSGAITIESATVGHVLNWGVKDPLDMGAAMAPAACSSIVNHLLARGRGPDFYDLIVTGDLGERGRSLLKELLATQDVLIDDNKLLDCGCLLYGDSKEAFSGGSGAGCVASVFCGHLAGLLKSGQKKRILLAATGALLSPNSVKQGDAIAAVSHVISFKAGGSQ